MKLVDISVKRPIGVVMFMIALILIGAISLKNLVIDLYPKLDLPIAVVVTEYEGTAPQEIEKMITRPLEGTIGTIEGIKSIESTSTIGRSIIIIKFDWGSNMDTKVNDIRDKLDIASNYLPNDSNKPMILQLDPTAIPIYRVSVSGDISEAELSQIAANTIKPGLERTPGVANVSLLGSKQREVKVEVNPAYLNAYGLTMNHVIQSLASENISTTAGTLARGDQELTLRINGEFESIEDINNLLIPLPKGGTVKLKDIATVTEGYKKTKEITKADGKPSLTLDISKKAEANTIKVTDELYKTIDELEEKLPEGVEINTVYDLSIFIRASINSVVQNLVIGGTLAILILLLFLRSLRATLIIAIAMPVAVITTFSLIYFTGETLNLITLGGLALGIGMMVDSGIVILENIFRYREQGYDRIEAAKTGAKEVGPAVIASALTTVAVFIPIVFVEGLSAEIFRPLALVVSFSLLVSLLVALTIVPMLAGNLLHNYESEANTGTKKGIRRYLTKAFDKFGKMLNWLYEIYFKALKWALRKRKTVVFGTLILILATIPLVPLVGMEFLPEMDQGEINIDIRLPEGTVLEETDRVVTDIEQRIKGIEEVDTIFTTAGGGGSYSMGWSTTNIGNIYIRLVSLSERDRSTNDVIEEIRKLVAKIPGADINVSQIQSGGMGTDSPITIKITGDDLEVLNNLGTQVKAEIEQVEGTRNVENSADQGRPEMQIIVDKEKAALYGLSFSQIMQTVRTGFNGQVATRYRTNGQEVDVLVTLPEEYKQDMNQIGDIQLQTPYGTSIPLKEVAELVEVKGPAEIDREDQRRQVKVTSDLIGRDLGSATEDIQERLEQIKIPSGYNIEISGQYEDMMESFDDLKFALILSIFLVYMVMAIQFEAITYPLVIMFSLPATFIGIITGLLVTGRSLDVAAFIGIIMLAGIVVNNAIVLVDYINILRRRGMERYDAILKAGPNRLRPILMTTLTTVLALIPLTLEIGEGAETQSAMATVVVFGLSFSTLVTLILVPVMYTYIDDFEEWIKNKYRNKSNKVTSN